MVPSLTTEQTSARLAGQPGTMQPQAPTGFSQRARRAYHLVTYLAEEGIDGPDSCVSPDDNLTDTDGWVDPNAEHLPPYVLHERGSVNYGSREWLNGFETVALATGYRDGQEYPEDWPYAWLVDLDAGRVYRAEPITTWWDGAVQLTDPAFPTQRSTDA